ncbi:MAG TPA: aspartyl protease family protein [Verrucomicrobiae bacterium]|nr:aspartyl protease family protein [Verrucomicrobiae bacterium]
MRRMLFCGLLCSSWLIQGHADVVPRGEFPFEFREGLLWVKVQVPESGRVLNFLLDSGAEASVVNLQTAKELGLPLGQRAEVRGVGVSMDGFWTGTRWAKANEVTLPNRLLALDLGKLSRSCARRVDGLIGAGFFKDRAVQIDFRESKVRLLASGTATAGDVVPLDARRCGIRVKASVGGKRARWFRVDTGCATPLQWVTRDVSPKDCSRKVAVGLAELGIPQTRTAVKIGAEILGDVETGLHANPIFEGEAGLVGNGLLSQFETVTIDSARGRLVLGPQLPSAPKAAP